MDTCEVFVAGGGPAGSACAWKLRTAGLDVIVLDKAVFPRDKVCAGWITPQVIDDLELDTDEYRRGRTFQPIFGFRVGVVGRDETIPVAYGHPVSFGIRRCEFDQYLIERSGARLQLGAPVTSLRRDGAHWIVNDTIRTPMLVGAGGHFCPVAKLLNSTGERVAPVAAQEAEFAAEVAVDPSMASSFNIDPEIPELYFCRDFKGYGWCFRKQEYLNIGFGRLGAHALPKGSTEFVEFLKATHRIPARASWRWRGHAYLLSGPPSRRVVDAGVILVGDAAGLAYPQSGEGIRPAIESGLMAASAILEARGRYTRDRLEPYEAQLQKRFGSGAVSSFLSRAVPAGLQSAMARLFLTKPWFVRNVVLNRWFLHAQQPALAQSSL